MFSLRIKLFFLILLTLFGCSSQETVQQVPHVEQGLMDLRHWDFMTDGPIELGGIFEFYWHRFMSTKDFDSAGVKPGFIEVPSEWNGHLVDGKEIGAKGFATFRARLLTPPDELSLALKIPELGTAFRVIANGQTIVEVGHPDTTEALTQPRYKPLVVQLPPSKGEIELIFHVACFFHPHAGVDEPLVLGTMQQLHQIENRRLVIDMLLLGSILIIGLYHIGIFANRREEKSPLFFAIFCFIIAIRMMTTDDRYLVGLLPNLNWHVFVTIEYLSYYVAVPAFALYLNSLIPKDVHQWVLRSVLIVGFGYAICALLLPTYYMIMMVRCYHIITILAIAYAFPILILSVRRKRSGAKIMAYGFIILGVSVINDILDARGIIYTGHWVHLGLFAFILTQAHLISYRFSKAFVTVDLQRKEIDTAYQKLKTEMSQREQAEKEKIELQEKLSRAQKMEAIGLLAGGVAHDLNNILSGTVTYPELVLMDLPRKSSLRPMLEAIRDSGLKAAAIVQDLLTLARRSVMNRRPVDVNALVRSYLSSPEFEQLTQRHPGTNVRLDLSPDLYRVMGSEIHLRKALMNLVTNAAEAQAEGGPVIISTENRYLDKPLNGYEDLARGSYATLSVRDHGRGIPAKDLRKIFEPFYTKKEMGRSGTGLGMSVVWGTVHDHQGYIDVRSEVDVGTTIDIYLPLTMEQLLEKPKGKSLGSLRGRGQFVLVVDDDPVQRLIAEQVLLKLGYQVESVASGEAAIAFLKIRPADLVILDMIMGPDMDGLDTYRRILRVRPGTRALVVSGFSENDRVKAAQALGAGPYIRKPYTFEKIGLAIRTELNKPARAGKLPVRGSNAAPQS